MCPEHSDRLDDGELPARTVAAVETRLQRLKRIALFSAGLLAAPSASDETGGTMGTVSTTTDGRRSARLTSTTETGDDGGTVVGGGTTQPRTAANIRAERMVLDRLEREARPSLAEALDSFDEFPETGGSTGTGWETYNEPRSARLASTTETGDDDDTAIDGGTTQGTVEGSSWFRLPALRWRLMTPFYLRRGCWNWSVAMAA